jgi:hypothetical protein
MTSSPVGNGKKEMLLVRVQTEKRSDPGLFLLDPLIHFGL